MVAIGYRWFSRTSCYRGAVFGGIPPELHGTGTIQKRWNRATIYAKTKRVLKQLSEIHTLECRRKNCQTQNLPSPRGDQPAKPALVFCLKKQPSLLFSYHKRLKDVYSHSGQFESDLQW